MRLYLNAGRHGPHIQMNTQMIDIYRTVFELKKKSLGQHSLLKGPQPTKPTRASNPHQNFFMITLLTRLHELDLQYKNSV